MIIFSELSLRFIHFQNRFCHNAPQSNGANDGNWTRVISLGNWNSAIELHPHMITGNELERRYVKRRRKNLIPCYLLMLIMLKSYRLNFGRRLWFASSSIFRTARSYFCFSVIGWFFFSFSFARRFCFAIFVSFLSKSVYKVYISILNSPTICLTIANQ